jgi:hypothetical protein
MPPPPPPCTASVTLLPLLPTRTPDHLPAPSSHVHTSVLPGRAVHLDLLLPVAAGPTAPGQGYVPPLLSYQPPPAPPPEKAPRLEKDEVYLPPQVGPPLPSLLHQPGYGPLDPLYTGPEYDLGRVEYSRTW